MGKNRFEQANHQPGQPMEIPVFGGPRHLDTVWVHADTIRNLNTLSVEKREPELAEMPHPDEAVEIPDPAPYDPYRYRKGDETAVVYVHHNEHPQDHRSDIAEHWEDLPKASELQQ